MPRPSSPLISHDAVVEASLRIIDREGLDAFSLPRLARELNVQTPSLYYHFRDRADILRTVARAIVLESRVPAPGACRTWVDWFVGISLSFRRAVLSHRNAAPILLEFMPRDVLIWNYELGVQILAAVGVPPEARIGVIDGLDTLTLGASLAEAARSPARAGQVFANVDADAEPMLADALAANTRTAEQLFADSIRSFLRGAVPGVPSDAPAPRALIARYRDTRAAAASHGGLNGSGLRGGVPWPPGRRSAGEQVFVGDGGGHMELYQSPRAVLPDGYASHPQRDGLGREDEGHPIGEPARVAGGPARRRARLEVDSRPYLGVTAGGGSPGR